MKKKLIGISVLAAALTLSTGITAFAGWKQNTNGWYYEREDGSWVGCGWFTDPDDGSVYYMDPDGYMMSATSVEGFKLGDDGRRIDKTEEDIQREKERKQRLASRPSPAKEQAAADLVAEAAKTGTAAMSTNRLAFQSEMKVFMDLLFIDTQKEIIEAESNATKPSTTEDNLETTYRFATSSGPVMEASLWRMSNPKNSNYKPESFDMEFNRNYVSSEADIARFDDLFRQMCVASLGENEGKAVADQYYTELAAGNARYERSGSTDSGNQYTMTYSGGRAYLAVICTELAPVDPNAAQNTEEAAEAAPVEEVVTSAVIVAGQAKAE